MSRLESVKHHSPTDLKGRPRVAVTLPDHGRCDTHRHYKLGCDQYERLLARCGQRCEICRASVAGTTAGKLFIDHSGPKWAVRGLLCNGCNTRLRDGRGWFQGSAEYLSRTWWVQECARVGVPSAIAPEPPIGSAIRDQYVTIWVREADGNWHPSGPGSPGVSHWSWERIYEQRGPHNMAPFDVYGPEGNQSARWSVEQALKATVAIDRDELLAEGRWLMARSLLMHLNEWDRPYYAQKARWAAGDYEPTEAELERVQIDLAIKGILDERERLYDIVMGFLHALPDGKERWDRATAALDGGSRNHTPTDIIEEAIFSALTEGAQGATDEQVAP